MDFALAKLARNKPHMVANLGSFSRTSAKTSAEKDIQNYALETDRVSTTGTRIAALVS